jgi:hypothetical protein
MNDDQRQRLEGLLYGLHLWEDPGKRKVFLRGLLRGHDIWLDLKYGGSQREAADSLLALCQRNPSKLLHGQSPLCALLAALSAEYGTDPDACAELDRLQAQLCAQGPARPARPGGTSPTAACSTSTAATPPSSSAGRRSFRP